MSSGFILGPLPSKWHRTVAELIGVIGGSGFIGTWLVERLLTRNHAVRIIDVNPSRQFPDLRVAADVRDPSALYVACRGCDLLQRLPTLPPALRNLRVGR